MFRGGIPSSNTNNILVLETNGRGKDLLKDSPEVRKLVADIELGHRSPIVDVDEFNGKSNVNFWPKKE